MPKTADALTLGGSTIIGNGGTIAYDSNPNRIYLINTLVDRKCVDELVFNSIGLTGTDEQFKYFKPVRFVWVVH